MRIKGMVCRRCISTVKEVLMEEGFNVIKIELGEVLYRPGNPLASLEKVKGRLSEEGFQVLDDKQAGLIAKTKELVEIYVANLQHPGKSLSDLGKEQLSGDFNAASALFSTVEGITLEHYTILRRIEKAKDLLANTKLSLADVAFQLGYSSVPHLSNQFKKTTGLTPAYFRKIKWENEPPITSSTR